MLTLVTRSLRARAAWLLAAFYLICVMSPALTLTLGSGKSVACLVQDNHSSSASHIHPVPSAGVHHVDADPAQQESDGKMSAVADAAEELSAGDHGSDDTHRHRSNQCCGLSCVSALPAAMLIPAILIPMPERKSPRCFLAGGSTDALGRFGAETIGAG